MNAYKRILAVGDVHGCLHTFQNLLDQHWNPKEELLIQLGDLIDRGNFSPQVVGFVRELKRQYPENTAFLRGNHEHMAVMHIKNATSMSWIRNMGGITLLQYEKIQRNFKSDALWFEQMPLFWENDFIFASHAGIGESAENPLMLHERTSIIWNRDPLKNLNKIQLIGHTPSEDGFPVYEPKANFCNIDTGACYGRKLTGVRLSLDGEVLEFVSLPTDEKDIELI